MKKIYTSIDIGSDSIKIVVGEYFNQGINILANSLISSRGIKKGLIVDAAEVIICIKEGIKQVSNSLGITIDKCIVNVPSYNSKFLYVTSAMKLESGKVEREDILKIIKKSVYSKLDKDYELLTVLPLDFIIDNKRHNNCPVSKVGKKLEFKGIMISTPKKNVYSVLSVLEACSLEVIDLTFGGIGDYYEVRNELTDGRVGAVINIGHETTTVSVINKGKFMNTEVINLGSKNIDKDLANIFDIGIDVSRKIKEKFASAHKRFIQLNETFPIKNNSGELMKLNQLEVSEIVMARLAEILDLAKKQISLLTNQTINYVVVTGGVTEIKHFKNLCFEIFGKDVIIYSVDTLGVRDNRFVTALGMIKYFVEKMQTRGMEYSMIGGEEEALLITPKNRRKKTEGKIITKLFGNFLSGDKEDK